MTDTVYDLREISSQVQTLILDSLDKADATCDLSTRLIEDLDAESLDYLDFAFRIERAFSVKIQRGRVEKELRSRLPHLTVKPNTDVSDELKMVLKELMPEISPARIDGVEKVKEVAKLFTVATFVRITNQAILEARPGAKYRVGRVEGYEPAQLGVPLEAQLAAHAEVESRV